MNLLKAFREETIEIDRGESPLMKMIGFVLGEIERLQRREFVMAQNMETGRYWNGARECIPPRFEEVPERAEGGPADEPFARRRPTLDQSNAWASAEEERDWWRDYALEIEERASVPPTGGYSQQYANNMRTALLQILDQQNAYRVQQIAKEALLFVPTDALPPDAATKDCVLCRGTGSSIRNNSFVPCPNCTQNESTAVTKTAVCSSFVAPFPESICDRCGHDQRAHETSGGRDVDG